MDLEGCSVSCSSSSLPTSAAEIAEDRMVEMELEAAEALADLAHLATRENGGAAETATNWGGKGKRVRKRVKTESPAGQSGSDLDPVDPLPLSSGPVDVSFEILTLFSCLFIYFSYQISKLSCYLFIYLF